MAKRVFVKGNYLLVDDDTRIWEFAKKCAYTKGGGGFTISSETPKQDLPIPLAEVIAGDWYDEAGVTPFTEATLEIFLQGNTGFNPAGTLQSLSDVPAYSGNGGKLLAVNITEDGAEWITAPAGGSVDFPNIAFVDAQNGDNLTAVVGDANKPFLNVSNAKAVANFIVIKPCNMTENITITNDNKHIHCMQGVTFTAGGVYVLGATVTNFTFTGKAVWNGTNASILRMADTSADINFQFAYALNCNRICFEESAGFGLFPYVKMTADFIRCNCINGTAYATRLRTGARFDFNIKFYIESQHDIFHSRSSGANNGMTINCPESRIIDDYETFSYGNVNRSVVRISNQTFDTNFVVNGNCVSTYTPPVSYPEGVIHIFTVVDPVLFPTLEVNGDVISDNQPCVTSNSRALYGEYNFNGNIIAKSTAGDRASCPLWLELTVNAGASGQIWRFNGSIITGGTRLIIGRGRFVYFKDCAVYNDDIDNLDSVIFCSGSGTTPAEIYSYNSSFEKGGAIGLGSELIKGNQPTAVIGTVNTTANVAFGATYADIWGTGYSAIPTFIVPKLP